MPDAKFLCDNLEIVKEELAERKLNAMVGIISETIEYIKSQTHLSRPLKQCQFEDCKHALCVLEVCKHEDKKA